MAIYRDDGIVLRTHKLGEADRIVTVIARKTGRIRAVAKGVRRTKSRFGARLEDLVKITVYVVGDRIDLVAVWDVVAGGLAPHRPPSTLLGVSVLGYEGQLVEIEGIAAVPDVAEDD